MAIGHLYANDPTATITGASWSIEEHAKNRTDHADVNVRSQTFKFISPDATETLKIPNSCNSCHGDKTTQWAKDALKSWLEFSPWRMAQ